MIVERGGSQATVTERIRNSDVRLAVGEGEIGEELARFAKAGDMQSVQELFKACYEWELRGCRHPTPDQIRTRTMANIDIVARMVDNANSVGGNLYIGAAMAKINPTLTGEVTRFYRSSVGYNPNPNLQEET